MTRPLRFVYTNTCTTNWLGVYSGYYDGSLNSQGSFAHYSSSTVYIATGAYRLRFAAAAVTPADAAYKDGGHALRCVLG